MTPNRCLTMLFWAPSPLLLDRSQPSSRQRPKPSGSKRQSKVRLAEGSHRGVWWNLAVGAAEIELNGGILPLPMAM